MGETRVRQPDDPMAHGWDGCVWGLHGDWLDAPMESVVEAEKTTRGKAIAAYAREVGCDFTEVRCTVGYGRIFTRQEAWEDHCDGLIQGRPDDPPETVPDDWMGHEETPCWMLYIDGVPPGVEATKLYLLEAK